jgi:hypothetical protein
MEGCGCVPRSNFEFPVCDAKGCSEPAATGRGCPRGHVQIKRGRQKFWIQKCTHHRRELEQLLGAQAFDWGGKVRRSDGSEWFPWRRT